MEITFQNKLEDAETFYDYMAIKTEQGKSIGKSVFWARQWWAVLGVALVGALAWAASGRFWLGLVVTISMFLFGETVLLLQTGFKPYENEAKRVYKSQDKSTTPREWQLFQLPITLTIDEEWLEIRNSEAVHRYRWRRLERISLTPDFIFIHAGTCRTCPVVYVPKRAFPSEQSFIEFGKKLTELHETNKNQPIGAQ
jgi:hypothetical protein